MVTEYLQLLVNLKIVRELKTNARAKYRKMLQYRGQKTYEDCDWDELATTDTVGKVVLQN